jgi:hypothetical protein
MTFIPFKQKGKINYRQTNQNHGRSSRKEVITEGGSDEGGLQKNSYLELRTFAGVEPITLPITVTEVPHCPKRHSCAKTMFQGVKCHVKTLLSDDSCPFLDKGKTN